MPSTSIPAIFIFVSLAKVVSRLSNVRTSLSFLLAMLEKRDHKTKRAEVSGASRMLGKDKGSCEKGATRCTLVQRKGGEMIGAGA